jgi:hypothetical protein
MRLLDVFENRLLKKALATKREKESGESRNFRNEFYSLYSLLDVLIYGDQMRWMRWAGT